MLHRACPTPPRQPARAENSFLDRGEFVAMKTLSSWEAACCDEHQFHAKIKVSARAILQLSFFVKHEKWSEQKLALSLLRLGVFHMAYEQLYWFC